MSRTVGNTFGPREGSVEIGHTYGLSWNTVGIGAGIKLDTVSASVSAPVELEFSVQIVTAFTGTGDLILQVGSTSSNGSWVDLSSAEPATIGYYPASNAVNKFRITADADIWVTFTPQLDTDAGHAVVIVKETTQNIMPVVQP